MTSLKITCDGELPVGYARLGDIDDLNLIMASEGDEEDFFSCCMPCSVWRSPFSGAWAGYVGVGVGSPLHGYDLILNCDIAVHGGVTFSNYRNRRGNIWWFGFDCWHLYDYKPKCEVEGRFQNDPYATYKTKRFAKNNVRGLAFQISRLERYHGGWGGAE